MDVSFGENGGEMIEITVDSVLKNQFALMLGESSLG